MHSENQENSPSPRLAHKQAVFRDPFSAKFLTKENRADEIIQPLSATSRHFFLHNCCNMPTFVSDLPPGGKDLCHRESSNDKQNLL